MIAILKHEFIEDFDKDLDKESLEVKERANSFTIALLVEFILYPQLNSLRLYHSLDRVCPSPIFKTKTLQIYGQVQLFGT